MNMKCVVLSCVLITFIPQPVSALPSKPVEGGTQAPSAAQLLSTPELMECSLERSQALWQFPNPVRLGDIPCQYLGSLGGPIEGASVIYTPEQLEGTGHSIDIDHNSLFLHGIKQPLDSFAPRQPARGQLIELSPQSLSVQNNVWLGSPFRVLSPGAGDR